MTGTTVTVMVLSGLCFLPACFPRLYILVEEAKAWAEAQSYCRGKYTDLASVHNEPDVAELKKLLEGKLNVWIGLHADHEAWRWSLENQDYYGEGEAGFRMWGAGEPNGGPKYHKLCVEINTDGKWFDAVCHQSQGFLCYNNISKMFSATGGSEGTSSSFILVNESKTWTEAQSYCREHYTDLASVRNQAENDQMKMMIQSPRTWFGLYRDSWKWSDGSANSFSNWAQSAPSNTDKHSCAVSNFGKWYNQDCKNQRYFVCYSAHTMKKQVVRLVLKKTDSSVDMEELREDILQKFDQSVKDRGLSDDVKLRWVEQTDGKVFHKKSTVKREKKKKKSCTLQ